MTSERSQAYGRVAATIRDIGPIKLLPAEQDLLRDAADTLLFCDDIAASEAAQAAAAGVAELISRLVESGRWTEESAARLRDDVLGCGPLAPVA